MCAALAETDLKDKPRELERRLARLDAVELPFTSMLKREPDLKGKKWEVPVELYKRKGFGGVRDGVDVTTYDSQTPDTLASISQKFEEAVMVSDFTNVTETATVNKNAHLADQLAKGMVRLKQKMEARGLSNEDSSDDDGATIANETRGAFKWLSATAQGHLPVDAKYRPAAVQNFTGTALTDFTEDKLVEMLNASFKKRRGAAGKLDAFVGIDLKAHISGFLKYQDVVTDKTASRQTVIDAEDRVLVNVVDIFKADAGEVHIHQSAYVMLNEADGEDTDFTHNSGVIVDMDMAGWAYNRRPAARALEDKGGGPRGIVDCIGMLIFRNTVAGGSILIDTTP